MSNKELPAPAGSEQSSVFSVFGFRNTQPTDEDFDKPLDVPGESSHAGLKKSAFSLSDLRHNMRENRFKAVQGEKLTGIPQEPARKLKSTLPDQAKVTAQSIADQQDTASEQPKTGNLYNIVRRYSRPQFEESKDDSFDSNSLLQKFNNSLTFSSANSQAGESDTFESDPDPHVLQRYFGDRRRSSPDVATLSQLRSVKLQIATRIRTQPIAEASNEGQVTKTMDQSANTTNTPVAAKSAQPSLCPAPVIQDSVDASSFGASESPPNSGFGILSKTRKFGAWLTKATEGEKVEVTKKDLNAFAPTSF